MLVEVLPERKTTALAARWSVDPDELDEVEPTADDLPLPERIGVEQARAVLEEKLRRARWELACLGEALAAYAATAER